MRFNTDRYAIFIRGDDFFAINMSVPRIDTQLNKALAQKLKDLRIARGLSQMRVTMDTGVNVSRAESGKRSLSVHSVAILCRYYELSLEEFFHNIELSVVPWE